jgi:hypothetical protein
VTHAQPKLTPVAAGVRKAIYDMQLAAHRSQLIAQQIKDQHDAEVKRKT